MTVSVTVDVDWAPDAVLSDTVSILDDYGIAATFFSTHDDNVDTEGHERAVHPNFLDASDDKEMLDEIIRLYSVSQSLKVIFILCVLGLRFRCNDTHYLMVR